MFISDEQVALFRTIFTGRTDVYTTYDSHTRKTWQVKMPVTDQVIRYHLAGRTPYGVYLLDRDYVSAVVADFDSDDVEPPGLFHRKAGELGLSTYIERSKSKGYHVWMFFDEQRALASKARLVVLHLLKNIQAPATEVFPKQDQLADRSQYGNSINTPLFGRLIGQGRTVFLDENYTPYPDQWEFLRRLHHISADNLEAIITCHRLQYSLTAPLKDSVGVFKSFGSRLPPCAQRMLAEGVGANQRVACFRLACQLRKTGISYDSAVDTLLAWSQRNHPDSNKHIIRPYEIRSQVRCAYRSRMYLSCGCEDAAVMPFCDPSCPIRR